MVIAIEKLFFEPPINTQNLIILLLVDPVEIYVYLLISFNARVNIT